MAMVLRANKHTNVGGHISSFASAATLYDVGYNHFWRAPSDRAAATSCSSRATRRRASTRAPSCSAA
jgi:pyruvate dehydrogenase complex dehydrogenase (E1) component